MHRCAVLCDVPFSSSDALPSLLRLDSDERLLCLIGFVHNSLFKVINMVTGTTNCVFHRLTIKNGQIKLRYTTSQRLDHKGLLTDRKMLKYGSSWGADARGGGRERRVPPPRFNILRVMSPQKSRFLQIFFKQFTNFYVFKIFKIKWPKSEEKPEFGGRWV